MNKKADHLRLGEEGEKKAAAHLERQGWKIEQRNWRPRGIRRSLELDIVARRGETLLFVEVKTRFFSTSVEKRSDRIPAYAAFTSQKSSRLMNAAQEYLAAYNLWDVPCRFDLICIEEHADGSLYLEQYENVIELRNSMDSRHSSRQPW